MFATILVFPKKQTNKKNKKNHQWCEVLLHKSLVLRYSELKGLMLNVVHTAYIMACNDIFILAYESEINL